MAKANILIDSCYWIALYTPQETILHNRANQLAKDLEICNILIPWPTLYEFVNTRLARRKEALFAFNALLKKENVILISDEDYKEIAIKNVFELNVSRTASISIIDEILRLMLIDKNLNIDYLVTFNKKDFQYQCTISEILILE